jgi:hypothetical protein
MCANNTARSAPALNEGFSFSRSLISATQHAILAIMLRLNELSLELLGIVAGQACTAANTTATYRFLGRMALSCQQL